MKSVHQGDNITVELDPYADILKVEPDPYADNLNYCWVCDEPATGTQTVAGCHVFGVCDDCAPKPPYRRLPQDPEQRALHKRIVAVYAALWGQLAEDYGSLQRATLMTGCDNMLNGADLMADAAVGVDVSTVLNEWGYRVARRRRGGEE